MNATQALDTIKAAIQSYYKEGISRARSHWLEEVRATMLPSVRLDHAILNTVKYSAHGWDQLIPSLVQLGNTSCPWLV